jgi:hypothetical protein
MAGVPARERPRGRSADALALVAARDGDLAAARDELARARVLWKDGDAEFLARIALDPR